MSIESKVQLAYSAIMRHFIETGRAPHFAALARTLGVDVEEARRLQRQAVEHGVGAWFIEGTDTIESFAPFYNVPNNAAMRH